MLFERFNVRLMPSSGSTSIKYVLSGDRISVPIDGMNDIDTIVGDILDDIFISMDKPPVVPGDRVEIIRLGNEEKFYGPGDKGTVAFIDDTHSIHVNWDNKGSIALLPECDCWKKL